MWLSKNHKDENINIIMDENIFYRILRVKLLFIYIYTINNYYLIS